MTPKQPYLIGLTGSIGMGKTETAKMFARLGISVFHADDAVHRLYEPGGAAVDQINREFPDVVHEGRVDRASLAQLIGANPEKLGRLEKIVHPLVAEKQDAFVKNAADAGAEMVVLDVPLLFETGGHTKMDAVVVVSAAPAVQRERVLERPGMTEEKFERLLQRQVADEKKRAQADFVVETDQGRAHAFSQVKQIVATLQQRTRTTDCA